MPCGILKIYHDVQIIYLKEILEQRIKSAKENLREAARIFRESKISNEKSNFFLFYQNISFCELVSKKIF